MSSEQTQPFNVGDEVEHKCGIVGTVAACERRVVNGSTRWVVDIDTPNAEKLVQAWPHNCKLVKAAQTVHVPKVRYGCSKAAAVGDMVKVRQSTTGNFYKVLEVVDADTIRVSIPGKKRTTSFPAASLEYVPTVAVRETVADADLEPVERTPGGIFVPITTGTPIKLPSEYGWRVDARGRPIKRRWKYGTDGGYIEQRQPGDAFRVYRKNGAISMTTNNPAIIDGLEEIQMEPEEATSSTQPEPNVAEAVDNLLVANLSAALVRALKFHAGGDEALRAEFARIIRADLAEHRPNNAEADLRERLEEATQEFARALSSEQSKTAEAIRKRDEARKSAAGWRSVVCTFEF